MSSLKDLFLDELADMYDAEKRIAKGLQKLAKAATNEELKDAFMTHLEETQGHVTKLESVFQALGQKAKGKACKATIGLLEEADEISSDNKGSPTINAALISAAQKVEHYEIGSYGTLREWATLLGNDEAAEIIGEILSEEEGANDKLTDIAESAANQEAMTEDSEEGEEEENIPVAERVGKSKSKSGSSRRSSSSARSTSKR
ncbi:MAG TPA: ferritin-like domain-containing protein [Opitutaceae bacterium]|nr:ferritin-like domain-containing protein [Opitutaceae bacterium]